MCCISVILFIVKINNYLSLSLVFLLHVNDLSNVVKDASINVFNVYINADVVIYANHADINQVRTNLQAAINAVAK